MPEVIADTSPIQYLYQIARLDLLPTLYGQIRMPQAVADELAQGRAQGVSLPDPISLSWMTLCSVSSLILVPDTPNLGAGEREVLSLATTTPDSLVILDDALARSYAQRLNIPTTGTLGVLLKGKQTGYVKAIAPLLDELDTLNFRLAPATRATVLKLANEQP
jgi:predicted nucleic acid-binding protein